MMRFKTAIAFLCFLAATACASGVPIAGEGCMPKDLEIGTYSFVTVALALVSFAIGLAYMYSKFREDPVIGVWAKDEAFNLVVTIFMFIGVLAFVTGACTLSYAYVGASPFEASVNYIDMLSYNNGLNVLSTLTHQSIDNQEKATAYLYIGVSPFYGEGVAQQAAYRAFSAQKEMAIDMFLPILASLNAQKYMLQGINWVAISILLPFAFVLRIVPFTRDFGNLLLALFFAMYIIVPMLYALSAKAFMKINSEPTAPCVACGVYDFNSYGLDGSEYKTGKSATIYRMGLTIPQAVFLPNLVLVVTITATMAISKALKAIAV